MKFYGQFDVPVDRFIFERYFPDLGHRGTFVECGAFDGETECSCRFFEESMGWTGYNLEPVPLIFERLAANRPDSRNLNLGLSDRTGTVSFDSVVHPEFGPHTTIGSINHGPEQREVLAAAGCTFEKIEVEVVTWKELVDREGIEIVDLMVLDVEGHELSVLSGMEGSDVLPHILCVEFGHVGFDKLRSTMQNLGYVYDINSYANAYFIRKDLVPAFAMRLAAAQKPHWPEIEADMKALHEENLYLRQREAELVNLVDTITDSKSWRAVQAMNDIRNLKWPNIRRK